MKALLTLSAFAMIAGGSSLSAQCGCECAPVVSTFVCPCPVYTCAGSPEYQDYWNNQVYYKDSPYLNGGDEDRNMRMNDNSDDQNMRQDRMNAMQDRMNSARNNMRMNSNNE
jgi:hypothetical protein